MTDVVQHFEYYLDQQQLEGEAVVDNGELVLTVEGKPSMVWILHLV